MQLCLKCQNQSPDEAEICVHCGADLSIWSETSVALKRMLENPRISYVRVAVSQDCCPACRKLEGSYAKDSAPKLPVRNCSHPLGCRCFYEPVLEEIYP